MRVTTKGQVTIPQAVREQAGIVPGTELEFAFENGRITISKAGASSRGAEWVRMVAGTGDVKMTTDEIMAMTRGED